jgi:NAD(P)-dependent dehydrogenase (short-subunit alcohol dehydrogenase family)
MPYSLKDRRVLVTGGSRGLGAVICEKIAMEGAHVVVNYLSNKARADEVAEKVQTYGVKAFTVQGVCYFVSILPPSSYLHIQDAGIPDDNARLVREAVEKLGGLDIIVANAGWTKFSTFKDLNALTLEEWNKVLINLLAPFRC